MPAVNNCATCARENVKKCGAHAHLIRDICRYWRSDPLSALSAITAWLTHVNKKSLIKTVLEDIVQPASASGAEAVTVIAEIRKLINVTPCDGNIIADEAQRKLLNNADKAYFRLLIDAAAAQSEARKKFVMRGGT